MEAWWGEEVEKERPALRAGMMGRSEEDIVMETGRVGEDEWEMGERSPSWSWRGR